jgi:hypothetical protein
MRKRVVRETWVATGLRVEKLLKRFRRFRIEFLPADA